MINCKGRVVANTINSTDCSREGLVSWSIGLNTIQTDRFLSMLLGMVPVVYHNSQDEKHNKTNGIRQDGLQPVAHSFNARLDQHSAYHHLSEPVFHSNSMHSPTSCSPRYDGFGDFNYCDGMDASETDPILQNHDASSDGDEDNSPEESRKPPKESSVAMALQILVPFLLAGFGTVSAGMVLDIVQHWDVFRNLTEVFILVPALLGLKGNLEMTLASRLSTAVQATVVGFLAAVAAVILGWIPEGKYQLDYAILLCSSSVATAFIASLLQGIIMVGVIVGSKKTGINPDNVATPIAASFGDLITLAILAWISQGLYDCLGTYSYVPALVGAFFLALTPIGIIIASKHPATKTVLHSGWEPVIIAMLISSIGGLILDTTVSDPNLAGIVVYTPVINGVNNKSAQVLFLLVIPGHLIFLYTIHLMKSGHTSLTPVFIAVYLLAALLQVFMLLWIADWMVHHIWRKGKDPDSFSIPYLTALGDLLGTALLAISFHFLWLIGDRDGDVGD